MEPISEEEQELEEINSEENDQEHNQEAHVANAEEELPEEKKLDEEQTKFLLEKQRMYELNSGIALKSGRLISHEELKVLFKDKTYIDIDDVETKIGYNEQSEIEYCTIGILVQKSAMKTSKSNLDFVRWGFTSLKKAGKADPALGTPRVQNGYKIASIFIYGQTLLSEINDDRLGGVYAIISPTPMPKSDQYDYSLKITAGDQIKKIGSALDFDFCRHINKATGQKCRNFVNYCIERYCENHIHKKVDEIKARRPIFQSTNLDLNQVKKEAEIAKQNPYRRTFQKKPEDEPEMTKEQKGKLEKWQAGEAVKLDSYFKKRAEVKPTVNPLNRRKKNPKDAQAAENSELVIDLNDAGGVSSDFIKKLMAKKTHSEKFGADNANPFSKRMKPGEGS